MQLRKKRRLWRCAHLAVACCFISKTNKRRPFVRAVYYSSSRESQSNTATIVRMIMLAHESFPDPKNKSGRGPPTSPTLRPRVLTPRDHFAHRGGGRAMIMHNSYSRCNPHLYVFSMLSRRITSWFRMPELKRLSRSNWQNRISFLLRLLALKYCGFLCR